MSYNSADLSVLAYANKFTLWHYKTAGDPVISGTGYFDQAADMLRTNDLIITQTNVDDPARAKTQFLIVTINTGVSVTVAPFSA